MNMPLERERDERSEHLLKFVESSGVGAGPLEIAGDVMEGGHRHAKYDVDRHVLQRFIERRLGESLSDEHIQDPTDRPRHREVDAVCDNREEDEPEESDTITVSRFPRRASESQY